MTADANISPEIRLLRLDADRWSAALERLRSAGGTVAADGSDPVGVLTRHRDAPVRARVVAVSGDRGSVTRLSIVGGEVLLILQATSDRGEPALVEPGAELRLCTPGTLWSALQAGLPPVAQMRAPAGSSVVPEPAPGALSDGTPLGTFPGSASEFGADRALGLGEAPEPLTVLDGESAGLLVLVEAWPTPEQPARVWARRWSVVDGALLDIRRRDGTITFAPRPVGSVAAELEWALAGAIGATAKDGEYGEP